MSEVQETGTRRQVEHIDQPKSSSTKTRKVYVLGVAFVAVLLLGTSFGMMLTATTPSIPTVIEPGSMSSEYSYVIFQDGATTYLRSGSTGAIAYSSASSYTAIQYAINAVGTANGGSIYLKYATYTIAGNLNITKSNITLSADPGTVIQSSLMPVLSIWGPEPYGSDFDPYHNRLYNVHISNIQFFYTGAINVTGAFIRIHRANLGAMVVPGGMTLENLIIQGPSGTYSTNRDYVGLQVKDSCGDRFTDVSVAWWGTGIEIGSTWDSDYGTWFPSDGNTYTRIHVGACDQGIWYSGLAGGQAWQEYWLNLKVFACAVFGIVGGAVTMTLESPHFEGFSPYNRSGQPQAAVNISVGEGMLSINNGEFQDIVDYGIRLYAIRATISNCFFSVGEAAIYLYYSSVTLINNQYDMFGAVLPAHKVVNFGSGVTAINGGYVVHAAGLANTNGANYIQVLHGMDATPYFITITTNVSSTVTGGWSYSSDPDYVTVYFANAGYYFVAWTATAY